ncbi:hypothetical protein E0T54_RS12555 [Enterococcus hirae]|nr:hypothetical protein [Enterococcus hirae]EMF0536143.1 hypothetical protein [Enterococcus hirae]
MVLSKEEVKKELHKIDLREIYRRYCGGDTLTEKECQMLKDYDTRHSFQEAIQLRIESMKEFQQIYQEKREEEKLLYFVDLLTQEEQAQAYLEEEYQQLTQCMMDKKEQEESIEFQPYGFDLYSQEEREQRCE